MQIVYKEIAKDITAVTFHTQCTHCGSESVLNPVWDEFALGRDGKEAYHRLCRCLNCDGLILIRVNDTYEGEDGTIENLRDENTEQVWPLINTLDSVAPERVRKLYDEAQKIRKFPSAFVVQIGRALEAVAEDRNAEGRTLNDGINWLIDQEQLPRVFGEMAHINRILRNWGAHDSEVGIEPENAEIVDEFFRAIIEYLYVAPAKVEKIQALLDARKESKDSEG